MAFKLVYTSAPKGIKEGSFGFCTVACSRDLSERTIAALEAFSGYRRIFVDEEQASQNPTVYSHVLLDDGETTLRVLSRIADAGLDYNDRNNKIACHLILEPTELREVGPTVFFSEPGLFDKRWEGEPQVFDKPFVLPQIAPAIDSCEEWKKTTGDSGWAGILASTVYTDRPVVLIVRPEHDVLRLYQEALSLLSPVMRWQATFSTFYTKTPPGIRCQWKAAIVGSQESQTLRAIPDVLVLDLTSTRMESTPDAIASFPQASNLIDAARSLSNDDSVSSSSNDVPSMFDNPATRFPNDDFETEVQEKNTEPEKRKQAFPKSLAFPVKKILEYARKLRSKKFFKNNSKERKYWRFVGGASIGVFALASLIIMEIYRSDDATQQTKTLQEVIPQNEVFEQSKTSVNLETPKSNADDKVQIEQPSDSNQQSLESQEEKINDTVDLDTGENVKEDDKENAPVVSSTEESSNEQIASYNSASNRQEDDGGTDLSALFKSPSLTLFSRPQFLTSEEYQTIVDFQDSIIERKFTVDFGVFQRKGDSNVWTLNGEIDADSQELFSKVLNLCQKYYGKLTVTCDLSPDQNGERQWLDSKRRTNAQEFDFSAPEPSNSTKVFFKTVDAQTNEQNGSFDLEINSLGNLVFHMSDEATRNYFLRSSKLKWTILLHSPNETEKDFVAETKYEQLLKPCQFDLLKGTTNVASVIELSNAGLLPLAVPSDLSYYDPVRNPKHSPALLVLLKSDATSSAFTVDSQMDDKKKSIVFIFTLKAEEVDAFKIRFTRNSQVIRTETIIDKETLETNLRDYFDRQTRSNFPYDSDYVSPEDGLQNAARVIESTLNRKLTFEFFLVSTTGKEQSDQTKYVFIGSANITPKELAQKSK